MIIKMKRYMFALLVCLFCLASIPAAGAERQVVRVGYPIQDGLTECDEEGNYSGYTYEYLLEIAQYTGWEYEFVQIPGDINDSLMTMMEMLAAGELDLMGSTLYNDGMAQLYDYAGYSYGTVYTVLNVPYEDGSTSVIDGGREHNLRVAVLPSMSRRLEELEEYCTLNNIEAELVYCEDGDDQLLAVQDGRADALLDVSLDLRAHMRPIARFSPRPFYFITTKGNQKMIQEINRAIVNIEQMDPYFSTMLYEKYFMMNNEELILSNEERAYLDEEPVIRVGYRVDAPPFQYADAEGRPSGIAIDILDDIAGRTGLWFEYVPADSRDELNRMVEEQTVDMVAAFVYDYEESRQMRIAMTRPYVTAQYVMAVSETYQDAAGSGIDVTAVPADYAKLFGDAQVMNSMVECWEALLDGRVSGVYGGSYTMQYYLNQPEYGDIRLFSQDGKEFRMSFGVLMPGNTNLLSILNKAVISMKEEQLQDILYHNILYRGKYTVAQMIRQNPIEAILVTSLLLLCVILLMGWVLRSRIHMNRKLALNLKRYREVFGLSSEHLLEYNYHTKELMVAKPVGAPGDFAQSNETYHLTEGEFGRTLAEDEFSRAFLELLSSLEEGVREVYVPCPDGECHWMRLTMRLVYDEDGKPAYKLGKVANIDKEKQEKDELMARATKDGLTRLLNADSVQNSVSQAVQSMEPGAKAALILLDIDYFKTINDTYGHPEGDRILRCVADVLRDYARKSGIAGRIGGDEFILFLSDVGEREVLDKVCECLCYDMCNCQAGRDHGISVSVGGILVTGRESYHELYQRADEILYLAKRNGRGRYEIGS